MPVAISTDRLEARISTDLYSMLKRAADQAEVFRLSLADQECFAQALLSPPKTTTALDRAFACRRRLLRAE